MCLLADTSSNGRLVPVVSTPCIFAAICRDKNKLCEKKNLRYYESILYIHITHLLNK